MPGHRAGLTSRHRLGCGVGMAPGHADGAAWGSACLTWMGIVQHTTFLPQEEPLHLPEPPTALSGWAQRLAAPCGTPFCQAQELSKGGCPDLDLGCDRRCWRASFGSGRSGTLCKLMLQETLERLTVARPSGDQHQTSEQPQDSMSLLGTPLGWQRHLRHQTPLSQGSSGSCPLLLPFSAVHH